MHDGPDVDESVPGPTDTVGVAYVSWREELDGDGIMTGHVLAESTVTVEIRYPDGVVADIIEYEVYERFVAGGLDDLLANMLVSAGWRRADGIVHPSLPWDAGRRSVRMNVERIPR